MSNVPAAILAARAPQVNLIPPEVASRRAAGRTRGLIIVALFVFVALLGGAFYWADTQKQAAEQALADEQAITAQLEAEKASYAEVPAVKSQLANAKNVELFAGSTEIRWVNFLFASGGALPAGVSIDSWVVTSASIFGVAAPDGGPFAQPDIGVLNFSGTSAQYPIVADLERAIDSIPGVDRTFIASVALVTSDGVTSYSFSGTARITADLLDQRFTEGWNVAFARERAGTVLADELAGANAALGAANALDVDSLGRDAAIAQAQARVDAATAGLTTFGEAAGQYAELASAAAAAEADVAAGVEGAQATLDALQASLTALQEPFDAYVSAILALGDEQDALDYIDLRISLAQQVLSDKEAALAAAQAALAAGGDDLAALREAVTYAQTLVGEAETQLANEQAPRDAAATSTDAARDAVAAALTSLGVAVAQGQGGAA